MYRRYWFHLEHVHGYADEQALQIVRERFPDRPVPGGTRAAELAAKRQDQLEAKAQAEAEKHRFAAEQLATYGRMVASELFGVTTVKIYANGYIRFGFIPGSYQKLLSIQATDSTAKKSVAGRAAGAILTGGINLHSSNKRGDVYLTIVTDVGSKVLHKDPPATSDLKAVKLLEAVGNSVIS
jgi:hypothetical protein